MPKFKLLVVALILVTTSCSDPETATLAEAEAACTSFLAIDDSVKDVIQKSEEDFFLIVEEDGAIIGTDEQDSIKKTANSDLRSVWQTVSSYDRDSDVNERYRYLYVQGKENIEMFERIRSSSTKNLLDLYTKIDQVCFSIEILKRDNLLSSD